MKTSDSVLVTRYFKLAVFFWAIFIFAFLFSGEPGSRLLRYTDFASAQSEAWFQAKKTDYLDNRAIALRRNSAGTIRLELGSQPRSLAVSYYVFGDDPAAKAHVSVDVDGKPVLQQEVVSLKKGQQAWVDFDLSNAGLANRTVSLSVETGQMQYFVIDQIRLTDVPRGRAVMFFLLQAAFAALLIAFALAMAEKFVVAPPVSSNRSWRYIDDMRGVGILLVLILHVSGASGLPDFDGGWLRTFVYQGHYGVEIFYIVSAFTLTLSVLYSFDHNNFSYRVFVHNRVLRIVPSFIFIFLVVFAFREYLVLKLIELSPRNIFDNFFLIHIFNDQSLRNPLNHTVWWSISTEFQFYMLLPAILFAVTRSPVRPKVLNYLFLCAVAFFVSIQSARLIGKVDWITMSVFYHADVFSLGMLLGFLFYSYLKRDREFAVMEWMRKASIHHVLLGLLVFLLVLTLMRVVTGAAWHSAGLSGITSYARLDRTLLLFAAVCLVAFIFVIKSSESMRGPLSYVGVLSYVIYLTHIPVLRVASQLTSPLYFSTEELYYLYMLTVVLAFSIFASLLVHRAIENPLLSRLKGNSAPASALLVSNLYAGVFAVFALWAVARSFMAL